MTSIAIDRFRARYRVPSNVPGVQSRLQQIVATALESAFEGAIDRAGVGADGIVCIRSLYTVIRLPLGESDSRLTSSVAEALAEAVAEATTTSSASFVYYSSHAHALIDMVGGALTGDIERQWAWKQAGIWRGDHPPTIGAATRQVMRTLTAAPRAAVAVLAHLASTRSDVLVILLATATDAEWHGLAAAVLGEAGNSTHVPEQRDGVQRTRTGVALAVLDPAPPDSLVARSAIARICVSELRDRGPSVRRALALLVMLEVDPAAAARGDRMEEILTLVEQTLQSPAILAIDRRRQGDATSAAERCDSRVSSGMEPPPAESFALSATTPDVHIPASIKNVQRQGTTPFGGLLYLIVLADAIGLPDVIVNDPRFSERSSRWVLHQIAMSFGIDADDPAALAFAGLMPGDPSPASLEPAAQPAELLAVEDCRSRLIGALRDALDCREESDEDLIGGVIERRGLIIADPGWIEVRLSLEDVSVDIRRSGLDRDPGWVPWLGVVVRLLYV